MPLFDEKDEGLVKAFLFNKIEKECDADPGIMADYILVTLQNDMSEPELKQHCKTDLVEFFGDATSVFVDTLFDSLAKKEYIKTDNSSNGGLQITGADRRLRTRGRSRSPPGHRARGRSRSPSREHRRFDPDLLDGPLQPQKQHRQQLQHQQRQQHQQIQQMQQDQQLQLQTQQFQPPQQQQFQQLQQPQQPQQQHQQFQKKHKPCFEFLRKGTCQRGDTCNYAHTMDPAMLPNMPFMMQPGFFPMRPTTRPPQQSNDQPQSATAIFITNIPDDSMNDPTVRDFFGRFGQITNVRLDPHRHTAVVDFSETGAQTRALGTTEAIFNNRFVRVHRARQQQQQKNNESADEQQQPPPVWRPKSAAIKKAELIEKYVEQQKDLMRKLTSIKDMPPATRKIIMDSINQIQTKIDDIRKPPQKEADEKQVLQSKLKLLKEEASRLGTHKQKMSLDKRPRGLVLRNTSEEVVTRELARFGEIESVDQKEDSVVVVRFKARWEAENAMKQVSSLDGFDSVTVDWEGP